MVLIHSNSRVLNIGDPLPQFSLPATDGMTVESHLIRDAVLVIVFTCNHCPYAQAYEDRLIALANHFDEEGVQFILINSNDPTDHSEDSFENMVIRAKEKEYPFPYCFDENQKVALSFGAICTPHCFVFDDARHLQYKGRVDDSWKEPKNVKKHELQDAISVLLSGGIPAAQEVNAIGCSIKWRKGNEPSATIS